jgi:long-chain fatty acid transport protein
MTKKPNVCLRIDISSRITIISFICLLLIFNCQPLFAGAYEWGGLGSRAQAMGGAFIGLADDWTAIYWNPAGLTQLEGKGWGFDFTSPHPVVEDGDSMANLLPANMETRYQIDTFAQYTNTEPQQFTRERVEYHFYTPAGFGGHWQQGEWSIGAGFYVPVGYYMDWDDSIAYTTGNISAKLFQELGIRTMNVSVARQINPKLSLGAGFDLLYGSIDYKASKTVANTAIPNYSWGTNSDCEGVGYEGIFGLLYKATDKVSVGAVYRTGGTINLKGDARSFLTLTALNEFTEFTQQFRHPPTYGIGLAYKPKSNLTLTGDWQRTLWSQFRIDVDYDNNGFVALTDKDYLADWKDSNRYRAGLEYKPSSKWALRAGYMFDQSALHDKSVSLSNVVGVDRHNITLGVGHQFENNLALDLIYGYAWGKRQANGVSYSQKVNFVGLSLAYKF